MSNQKVNIFISVWYAGVLSWLVSFIFSIAGLVHENELGPCRKEDTVGTDAARTPRDRSGRTGEGGREGGEREGEREREREQEG